MLMVMISTAVILMMITPGAMSADFLINCGLPKSTSVTNSLDGRLWRSDDDPTFAPAHINAVSTAVSSGGRTPYTAARIFNSTLSYTFPFSSPGTKFLRLYFSSDTSYNTIPPSQFSVSLEANNFSLLRDFSPYIISNSSTNVIYEFQLVLEATTPALNLTFSPGNCSNVTRPCLGFINGIEIVPVPDGLYINTTKPYPNYVNSPDTSYFMEGTTAMQTVYRLNVGGSDVQPETDAGKMGRAWYDDKDCIVGFTGTTIYQDYGEEASAIIYTKIPAYTAPRTVYGTQRHIGEKDPKVSGKKNLTWRFEVNPGFDYLVRLHFCEMDIQVTGILQRVFYVLLNGERAGNYVDVWDLTGGLASPVYQDYIVHVYGDNQHLDASNGTKVPLLLAVLPDTTTKKEDVLLNGVEILKLSDPYRNLAVPNPPSPLGSHSPSHSHSHSHLQVIAIIGGILGGGILLVLATFACLLIWRRAKNKDKAYTTTSTEVTSTLPTDLCRRFSLAEIKAATSDFDEAAIIGRGGFGKVYKGTIVLGGCGGATIVAAIKRLNPTSKQGACEFHTEVEMLSRLRHLHLVSLIGYCEEQGEMILVYEYMPRGSLRDHLIPHKNNDKDDASMVGPLWWKQRLMICVGAARGLHYLHTCAKQAIIHRDVKSSNILLDHKWTAKVSDFGLSKVGSASERGGVSHVSTMVKGSFGYLDPEYLRLQQLTTKSDVYSFGVVLFEVLCARAVVDPNLPKDQVNLAIWARKRYKSGTLDTIVDPNLKGQISAECLSKFGEIAEMCVRNERSERPSMEDVVGGLEFALQLQQTAEKNNNINGDQLGGFKGPFGGANINSGSKTEDELTTSGENLSLNTSISTTAGTADNSKEQAFVYFP